jgi:hypothetical protein
MRYSFAMMALVGAVYAAPHGGGSYGGHKGYGGSWGGESKGVESSGEWSGESGGESGGEYGGEYGASTGGYAMPSSVSRHRDRQLFDRQVLTIHRPDTMFLHPPRPQRSPVDMANPLPRRPALLAMRKAAASQRSRVLSLLSYPHQLTLRLSSPPPTLPRWLLQPIFLLLNPPAHPVRRPAPLLSLHRPTLPQL